MATCRSCGAGITWAITGTGRKMPLDREPTPDGNVVVVHPSLIGAADRVRVLTAEELAALSPDRLRYTSHFATCPHASTHRKDRT